MNGSKGIAQSNGPESRKNFVIHLYVDPLYGDDQLAGNKVNTIYANNTTYNIKPFNPASQSPSFPDYFPLKNHPQDPSWTTLQHLPFSFKTVTAALDMIYNQLPVLPYTVNGKTVERYVIHCLPGLYGPIPANGPRIDPRTGLPWNGETFPLEIGERVSIQGASALNTIFDANYAAKGIFIIRRRNHETTQTNFTKCFIDSVTIRGTRGDCCGSGAQAGISIPANTGQLKYKHVIISNCFIVDNFVGIAIDGYPNEYPSPVIVNNTIAWNRIGIWNGQWFTQPGKPSTGYSRPRIFNNIIDSRDVLGVWNGDTSGFEGVDPSDLTIHQIKTSSGTVITVDQDYNAYNPANVNKQKAFGTWPKTLPRSSNPSYQPIVTMSGSTGVVYFLNEMFYNVEGSLVPNQGFLGSRSPHDFRLSPVKVSLAGIKDLNPMVNKGVDTSLGTLRFDNFDTNDPLAAPEISDPPGLKGPGDPPNDTQYATMHCWDLDCEGFGNPRIVARAGYPAPPPNSTNIDLGADEMDSLIMGGYIDGTTVFSRFVPDGQGGTLSIPDHTLVFFFNLPPSLNGSQTYARPFFSSFEGGNLSGNFKWWDWAQGTSGSMNLFQYRTSANAPLVTSNYTIGYGGSFRWIKSLHYPGNPQSENVPWEPFMRNLECDISPHLISDWHPKWATHFSPSGFPTADEFPCNPWYHHATNYAVNQSPGNPRRDNHYLYYKPTHQALPSAVLEGTINPPGSWSYGGVGQYGGYIGMFPTQQFGPYGYQGSNTYAVDAYGMGDLGPGPDVIPDSTWLGVRYNCEVPQNGGFGYGNMQSFLAINGEPPVWNKTASQPPKKIKLPGPVDWSRLEKAMKAYPYKSGRKK